METQNDCLQHLRGKLAEQNREYDLLLRMYRVMLADPIAAEEMSANVSCGKPAAVVEPHPNDKTFKPLTEKRLKSFSPGTLGMLVAYLDNEPNKVFHTMLFCTGSYVRSFGAASAPSKAAAARILKNAGLIEFVDRGTEAKHYRLTPIGAEQAPGLLEMTRQVLEAKRGERAQA